jgi:3-oxoacyl-[acyl-carrier protein] reductase
MREGTDVTRTPDVVLVSGATGGIGSQIVETLAADGAVVVMLGRSAERLEVVRRRIAARIDDAAQLVPLEMDINVGEAVESGVAGILERLGRIDALVHAAGDGPVAPLLETTEELWAGTVNAKLLGAVRLARAVGRAMVRRRGGRMVFINGSFRKEPDPLFPINGTVNAGLAAFAKAISHDLGAFGIRVNVVDPGATETTLWRQTCEELADRLGTDAETVNKQAAQKSPMGMLPTPVDVAEVVRFLLSPAARCISGTSVTVDAGASVAV